MITRENPDVAGAYDRWADTYESDSNRTRDLAGEVLRHRELNVAGRRVVEIGCGTGLNTLWLHEEADSLLGIDISDGMLRKAKARVQSSKVRFLQHDVRRDWPIETASADLIIAMLVLEHVEHLDPIYAEVARVLRPGGELFVCELHPMRQTIGRQAEFTNPQTGQREQVAAFLHQVSEYVNGGLKAGLRLTELGEWWDAGAMAAAGDLPRLVSVSFEAHSC